MEVSEFSGHDDAVVLTVDHGGATYQRMSRLSKSGATHTLPHRQRFLATVDIDTYCTFSSAPESIAL